MFFSLSEILVYISESMDLRPGDMIATGSPQGAGASRRPPRFLIPGDELEFEIAGIGVLKNSVCNVPATA